MDPKLKCRMVKSRFPEEGTVVMAKVIEIQQDSVTVSLLEFNNLKGKLLLSQEPTCITKSILGRVEPMKVTLVDKRERYYLLNRSLVTFEEQCSCEQEFNKRKYVQSVLLSVAEDLGKSLKEIYELARWPSYEDLLKLHEADWVEAKMGKELSKFLLDRIKLMRYSSWRIKDPSVLRLFLLYQKIAVCWAFALVMQTEACLKLNDKLPRDSYLSVQDLINKVPKDLFEDGEDGDLYDLEDLAPVLQYDGIVLEEACPLTYSLVEQPRQNAGAASKVKEMEVHSEEKGVPPGYLESMVMDALKATPVCASVVWFDSYIGRKDYEIFKATPAEVKAYEKGQAVKKPVHTMLLTGDGVDKRGNEFLEFQDSYGDVNNGDRGYLRFARDPFPIIEYIQLKV